MNGAGWGGGVMVMMMPVVVLGGGGRGADVGKKGGNELFAAT